jgi:hypothetical protein
VLRHEGVVLPQEVARYSDLSRRASGRDCSRERTWIVREALEEAHLRVHMAVIRKALGERQFGRRYISNIEEGAYSFIGSVVCIE